MDRSCKNDFSFLYSSTFKTPGIENGSPLQYSCLENSTDQGNWCATVHGVAELGMAEQLNVHAHTLKPFPVGGKPKFLLLFEKVRNYSPKALLDHHNIVVFSPGSSLNHLGVFFFNPMPNTKTQRFKFNCSEVGLGHYYCDSKSQPRMKVTEVTSCLI